MIHFTQLYAQLDSTTRTNQKVAAMAAYFQAASADDAAWALYFLSGRRIKNLLSSRKLHAWALEAASIPEWLFGECYDAVGDIAETVALLLPPPRQEVDRPLSWWVEERLLMIRNRDEAGQRVLIMEAWESLGPAERFIWNKLLTGGFRVGVSQLLLARAVGQVAGVDSRTILHRLMGEWSPTADFWNRLLSPDVSQSNHSQPYPFFLAYPLEGDPSALGPISDWQAEWKWDGIRAQVISRQGEVFIWSRGEELVTDRFPELQAMARLLPDGTVVDGEILPWKEGEVLPFARLQTRIGRKQLSRRILADVPVVLMAYDLLEEGGDDIRMVALSERRRRLEQLVSGLANAHLAISPLQIAGDWDALAAVQSSAREHRVEGLMLKRAVSPYRVGRQRGDWFKWKVSPLTVDAVLIYAQRGSGKRASLYTDYTFGVWNDSRELVPFAKAYSGLTDAEIRQVDAFIRRNTVEKFGPVRTVRPALVFELAFEGIQRSTRHKSGIAVRFPRILNWRRDKPIEEADTLETIRALISKDDPA